MQCAYTGSCRLSSNRTRDQRKEGTGKGIIKSKEIRKEKLLETSVACKSITNIISKEESE